MKATELVGSSCTPDITVTQYWSTTGIPGNGDNATEINKFQIPFSQKYNTYYLATRFNGYDTYMGKSGINRFRNAIQILTCDDGSVSSQVFAAACDGVHDDGSTYNFGCNGLLTCEVADSIW